MTTKLFVLSTATPTSIYPWAQSNFLRVISASKCAANARVVLAHDPEKADLIVFTESTSRFQLDVLMSSIYQAWPQKCFVFCFLDNPEPVIPGLYVGLQQRHLRAQLFEGAPYIRVADNVDLERVAATRHSTDLLFSFVGKVSNCPRVRGPLIEIDDDRALLLNRDSGQSENDQNYVEVLARSKFVLCPRGIGPSSWRLFETMRAGRVPVVISDDWVPQIGIDWESCSLRVPESDIDSISTRLRALESSAADMGHKARTEWLRCLSYDHVFSWIADRGVAILQAAKAVDYRPNLSTAIGVGIRSRGPIALARDVRQVFRR